MMSKPKRLHPTAMIFKMLEMIKDSILGLLPLAVLIFRDGFFSYIFLILIGIAVIMIISSVVYWLRFTYEVKDDEIRIEQGIFVRKKRYISKNRIQSIDLTANVLHRIFGLVKVQIETARSGGAAEASLSAVRKSEGERIRNELKSLTSNIDRTVETEKQQEPIQKISFGRLFIAGTASGSIGVILALVVFASQELEQFIPDTVYEN